MNRPYGCTDIFGDAKGEFMNRPLYYLFYSYFFTILSLPKKGRRTSGTITLPSGC